MMRTEVLILIAFFALGVASGCGSTAQPPCTWAVSEQFHGDTVIHADTFKTCPIERAP